MSILQMDDQAPRLGEEVRLTHVSDHLFELKKSTNKKIKHVCAICGEDRRDARHGLLSFNKFGSGANRFVYQKVKKSWGDAWLLRLGDTALPRPCRRIEAMGRISFPSDPPAGRSRDEENYRYPLSKFLADSLTAGGYLKDDDWSRFRFRELELGPLTPGQQVIQIVLMPEF